MRYDLRQEPSAGNPHAGICGGGDQQWSFLLRPFIPDDAFDAAWCALIVLFPQTAGLVAELARDRRLFLLSNTDPIHFAEVRRRCAGWLDRFTGLFLSYEEHVAKPDRAFFERALARFDLDPATCLFLDDRAENVAAARELGIAAERIATISLDRVELVRWGLLPPRRME